MANKPTSKPADNKKDETKDGEPERQRAALSMEKRLAITVAALLAMIETKGIAKGYTGPEVAQAKALADEVNTKTIGPITDRIAALQKEIQEFSSKPENFNSLAGAQKMKDLINELAQKQRRLATLKEQATGA